MKRGEQREIRIRILQPALFQCRDQLHHMPPRSKLYGLVPCHTATIWGESLTSYLNRLGWAHGVSPRDIVMQELLPFLNSKPKLSSSPNWLSTFSGKGGAISLNGTGSLALEGAILLERLTVRSDLHLLTLRSWIGDLPSSGNLRTVPAWCDACYAEWREQATSLYQLLLWMLRVVTICPRHKRRLIDRCPQCHKYQPVIAPSKAKPGECTRCGLWLGTQLTRADEAEVTGAVFEWQHWVLNALESLRLMNLSSGLVQWATFFPNFASGMKNQGALSAFAKFLGIKSGALYRWVEGVGQPSFEKILYLCYACGVTPQEVLTNQVPSLKQMLQIETTYHPPRLSRQPYKQINQEQCREFIQRVLHGKEGPLGVTQMARHLGCNEVDLLRHFPQECTLVTRRVRLHRKQQKETQIVQGCEEVRQAVATLHAQGFYPSFHRVSTLLSRSGSMRQPEMRAAWLQARHELGLELPLTRQNQEPC
jgi:transcriptional regulator with XRE-family HTH domain